MENFERYGEFAPILEEIFKRRAEEFDLTEDEINEDIKTFLKRVKRIQVVPGIVMKRIHADGSYMSKTRSIKLSDELLESDDKEEAGKEMLAVLTHEVYHACSHKKQTEIGISRIAMPIMERVGVLFNEGFNEAATARTVFDRSRKQLETARLKFSGYNEISSTPMLLATAVGLTEKEVLKAGIKSYKDLEKLILSRYSEYEQTNVKGLLAKLELHVEAYQRIISTKSLISDERGKELIKLQVDNISQTIYNLASMQMDRGLAEGREKIGDVQFRALQLNKLLLNYSRPLYELEILSDNDLANITRRRIGFIDRYINSEKPYEEFSEYRDKLIQEDFNGFRQRDDAILYRRIYDASKKESRKFGLANLEAFGFRVFNNMFPKKSLPAAKLDDFESGYKSMRDRIRVGEVKYNPDLTNEKKQDDKIIEEEVK